MTRSGSLFGSSGPVNPRTGQVMSSTYDQADKVNKEGVPAFSRPLEEDVLSVLTTQTLSNTFYATKKELAKELVDVVEAMSQKDPAFLAKALVYARSRGLMKLAPTVGLAVLSKNKTPEGREAFRKVFRHVIRIPDDLREFATLVRTGKFGQKAFMGLRKTVVQNWLRHMSEYHGVKYGSTASEGVTLRDILRLTHPRPTTMKDIPKDARTALEYERLRNGAQEELFGWLVKGWENVGEEPSPTNPMIWALERLKRTESVVEAVALIEKYKLPWEVVVPSVKKMTEAHWGALVKEMPYMALLRNLNTMERHGVLAVKGTVQAIAEQLRKAENVRKSKQLPFRFFNAFKAYTGPQEIRDALADALEASFENVPEIKGLKVLVSNDISSSMSSAVSDRSQTTIAEIAGIFGAALFKKCEDVELIPFDDRAHPDLGRVSKRDSIMSIAKQIGRTQGGTNLAASIEHVIREKRSFDVFIGITDNEDWAGRGFLTVWEEYKKKVNKNAKAFLVTVAATRDGVAPANYPDVFFTYGWSDSVLRYISNVLSGGAGQVDAVRSIDLDKLGRKDEPEEAEAVAG